MKRKLISVMVAGLSVISPFAVADDDLEPVKSAYGVEFSGSVSIGAIGSSINSTDPSKFKEYRDLNNGAIGGFSLQGRGDQGGYFNAFGENIGRDDQFIDIRGGKYGLFKFQLYDNEMRHTFGSGLGALTPYPGAGANVLQTTFPNLNYRNWYMFDDSVKRQDIGGMFELSNNSPWYFRTDVNQVKREGIKVTSAAQGTSPGNGFVQLPTPVDYTTQNYAAEAGYVTKRFNLSANLLYSKFDNGNPVLNFSNGFFGTAGNLDTAVQPPNNTLLKFSANGTLRQLPLESTLSGRVTYGNLTNTVGLQTSMLGAGSTSVPTGANTNTFNGNVYNNTASLSLTSRPIEKLDTRVYWNWLEKVNNSTQMSFLTAGLCAAPPCTPELFGYKKNNAGVDVGYRLNATNKVSGGFDYLTSTRNRPDFVLSNDKKVFGEWKTSAFETIDAKFKYQYMERRSTFLEGLDPGIDTFVRRFDLANNNQQLAKLVFDYTPMPLLDLGVEALYKHNDYKDTTLGRTSDFRQEYYGSVSYGDPQKFRVMLFGDVEFTQYDSYHRVCTTVAPNTGNCDPNYGASGAPNSTAYSWAAKNRDNSYQVGLGADWVPGLKWKVNSSLTYAKTNGATDFAASADTKVTPTAGALLYPIHNNDNTTKVSFNLRTRYDLSKQWNITGGYAFERYRYSDIGVDGFSYTVATNGTQTSYYTGGGALTNYNAQTVYVVGTYKF